MRSGLILSGGMMLGAGCSFTREPVLVSAARDGNGQHSIRVFSADRVRETIIPLSYRAHDVALRPDSPEIAVFDRRPGQRLTIFDWQNPGKLITVLNDPQRHFYGHGVFSADGRWLYTTENNMSSLSGVIGIYDAKRNYRRVGEWPLELPGPHEIKLMPDGNTLVIAVGGIQTHPDRGRATINPDNLQPALIYLDRNTGKILEQQLFIDTALSIRHLDVSDEGLVAIGMQYQGENDEALPLAALHSRGERLQEIKAEPQHWLSFNGYVASVALLPEAGTLALTSPRGNKLALVDIGSSTLMSLIHNRDCAGLSAINGKNLAISNGLGEVQVLACRNGRGSELNRIQYLDCHWDNHMIAI